MSGFLSKMPLRCFIAPSPLVICLLLTVLSGCDHAASENQATSDEMISASGTALDRMRAAGAADDWVSAWDLSNEVLIESQDDPDALAFVAEVAFRTGHESTSADLMLAAVEAEDFKNLARVQQTFTVLVTQGRLFDGIELLQDSTQHHPEVPQLRRMVFDYLVGTEQHAAAAEHYRELIRQRAFDRDLLLTFDASEKRRQENDSLAKMVQLNPTDLRPLIGAAKRSFDDAKFDDAIEQLKAIIDQHPEFMLAQGLLGRSIVTAGRYDELPSWAASLPSGVQSNSEYWMTLGDWAMHLIDPVAAATAYGKAAALDVDRYESWSRLEAALNMINAGESVIDPELLGSIRNRTSLLNQRRQAVAELYARSKASPESAIEIANALQSLGQSWEAEAWAAVAMAFPDLTADDRAFIDRSRRSIISGLSKQTAWQDASKLPDWDLLPALDANGLLARLTGSGAVALANRIEPQSSWRAGPRRVPVLVDQAKQRGLDFYGRTADDLAIRGIRNHEMIGCGGGVIDFNLDGWPDLYLANAGGKPPLQDSGANALFRNLAGQFSNVTSFAGGADHGFSQGVAVGDINEDGFDDLIVLNYGPNHVWINQGDGTFVEQSERWLPADSQWSTSAAIADLDRDGISDLVVVNYCAGLEPSTEDCFNREANMSLACSPNHFPAEPDRFYRGDAAGRFVSVTELWQAAPAMIGRGLGVLAGPLDGRAGVSVLIANDMTDNHLWIPSPPQPDENISFTLKEVGALRGVSGNASSLPQGSMGIAIADFDYDGKPDFYVTNYEHEYNTLYISGNGSLWDDETSRMGLVDETMPMVGFGTAAIDFDNNGESELIVTNGHIDQYGDGVNFSPYEQPCQIFQRNDAGRFSSISAEIKSVYFEKWHVGRALISLDANRDGRVDVMITHQTEPVSLLINETEPIGQQISFRLVATKAARNAVGAVVTLDAEQGESTGYLLSGDGFLGSHERVVRFGLGQDEATVSVTVQWPGGESETWKDLAVGQEWLLVETEREATALARHR